MCIDILYKRYTYKYPNAVQDVPQGNMHISEAVCIPSRQYAYTHSSMHTQASCRSMKCNRNAKKQTHSSIYKYKKYAKIQTI